MSEEFRIESIEWDDRNSRLAQLRKDGWIPTAISSVETVDDYHGLVVVLFKREISFAKIKEEKKE